jgi:hypothetical protein
MTRAYEQHLTLDEIDALLEDAPYAAAHPHLVGCTACRERIDSEREIVTRLAALPYATPSEHFADRVMARVQVPELATVPARRSAVPSFRRFALAASILVTAMVASAVWSSMNRELLSATTTWLADGALSWLWVAVRGVGANVMEQPWYAAVRGLFADPARIGMISGGITLLYLGGVFALRKLMALPTQGVAHAHA